MIAQGTDGCSRGVLMEGVMAGHKEWFQEGHGITSGHLDKHGVWMPDHEPSGKIHLWASPPAVADAMLEELLKLSTFRLLLMLDAGVSVWPSNMFEPLLWAFSSLSPVTGPALAETGHCVDKRGIGIVTHLVILKDEDGEIWEGQEDRASKLNTEARCKELNRTPNFPQRGPFPLTDPVGMGCAVDMLYRSLTTKGRVNDHIQFGTMRKGRSTETRFWASSPVCTLEGSTFSGSASRIRFTTCPTQSEWFSLFLQGAQDCMGYETQNQKAVIISAIVRQLEIIEEDIADADTQEQAHFLVKSLYLPSRKIQRGDRRKVSLYNCGKRVYFGAKTSLLDQEAAPVRDKDEGVIDADIDVIRFGIRRTYHKSSESRARAAGIPKDQVETMNRWQRIERSKGKMPQFDMADHYADAKQLSTLTWRYSYTL
ncbi:hypothetical protein ACHAWO_000288 [Cyclotella atomus]|uniref:Uncharacterized protein n=1 Tax=Cyclotella atomus TaxID=382360 RepID=A0ABD3P1H6_9STRA